MFMDEIHPWKKRSEIKYFNLIINHKNLDKCLIVIIIGVGYSQCNYDMNIWYPKHSMLFFIDSVPSYHQNEKFNVTNDIQQP
jgi:hypothetical protein